MQPAVSRDPDCHSPSPSSLPERGCLLSALAFCRLWKSHLVVVTKFQKSSSKVALLVW